MNVPEPVSAAREWVEKAERDLIMARQGMKLKRKCPYDLVCFHAQQCVEKYLKALLTTLCIAFPRTHEIERLADLLPESVMLPLPHDAQENLTTYATTTRYPGDYVPVSLEEAREALRLTRRVREAIRERLPKQALSP